MGEDTMMCLYLQRLVGYTLTGITREHALAFHYGSGANGKSTFLLTLHALMGEYGRPAHPKLIFRSPNGDRHLTERASLFRRRFVTCSETSEANAFDEGTLKDLTSEDLITARRMREDEWQFPPTHKLHLAGNERPVVRATDDGFWRRIHLVPWLVTIPEAERDHGLSAKLRDELPGILAWGVRGCAEWQRCGLAPPERIVQATREYRGASDTSAIFLGTTNMSAEDESHRAEMLTSKAAMRHAYEDWCREQGYEPLGARRFAEALKRHGVTDATMRVGAKVVSAWRGIRLLDS
jgi:putative DNA primase/helicase